MFSCCESKPLAKVTIEFSAFILMSDDQSALELFLPDHTVILKKTDKNVYKNNQYKYDSDNSILYVEGIEKYKGNVE